MGCSRFQARCCPGRGLLRLERSLIVRGGALFDLTLEKGSRDHLLGKADREADVGRRVEEEAGGGWVVGGGERTVGDLGLGRHHSGAAGSAAAAAAADEGCARTARLPVAEFSSPELRVAYDVFAAAGRWGWLEGKAQCCFCSAVKFQGKNAVACSGGLPPAAAQAVR